MCYVVFEWSDDKQSVKCKICAPYIHVEQKRWILRRSTTLHIRSPNHKANAQKEVSSYEKRFEEAVRLAEVEDDEQDLDHSKIQEAVSLLASSGDTGGRNKVSEAERRMWAEYDTGGGEYLDIAEDAHMVEDREARRRYDRDVGDFGLWNEEFDIGKDDLCGDPEEDDMLAEAMQNACESQRFVNFYATCNDHNGWRSRSQFLLTSSTIL